MMLMTKLTCTADFEMSQKLWGLRLCESFTYCVLYDTLERTSNILLKFSKL